MVSLCYDDILWTRVNTGAATFPGRSSLAMWPSLLGCVLSYIMRERSPSALGKTLHPGSKCNV